MGCKRVLYTSDWLPTLARPDVGLVTEKIVEITPDGVRTADGEVHGCDIILYATGFAATEFLAPMRIAGRGGVELTEAWRDGAYAYLGLAVPGFPNLFLMYGPNTNTGNTSVLYFHEAQAGYLVQAVRKIAEGGRLEVRQERRGSSTPRCSGGSRAACGRVVRVGTGRQPGGS